MNCCIHMLNGIMMWMHALMASQLRSQKRKWRKKKIGRKIGFPWSIGTQHTLSCKLYFGSTSYSQWMNKMSQKENHHYSFSKTMSKHTFHQTVNAQISHFHLQWKHIAIMCLIEFNDMSVALRCSDFDHLNQI